MKAVVLDASVAIKWFVPEDEISTASALGHLGEVIEGRWRVIVPELFFFEVFSVLVRRGSGRAPAARAISSLQSLGFERLPLDADLAARAEILAGKFRLTGYDAAYAALAESLGIRWLTFDAEAHRRISQLGISELA